MDNSRLLDKFKDKDNNKCNIYNNSHRRINMLISNINNPRACHNTHLISLNFLKVNMKKLFMSNHRYNSNTHNNKVFLFQNNLSRLNPYIHSNNNNSNNNLSNNNTFNKELTKLAYNQRNNSNNRQAPGLWEKRQTSWKNFLTDSSNFIKYIL